MKATLDKAGILKYSHFHWMWQTTSSVFPLFTKKGCVLWPFLFQFIVKTNIGNSTTWKGIMQASGTSA